jgi:hypothetical protein
MRGGSGPIPGRFHGFVTKHRRSKIIKTANGDRRVQDSNAYEVHTPTGGLASVPAVARKVSPSSGSENPSVSERPDSDSKDLPSGTKSNAGGYLRPVEQATGGGCRTKNKEGRKTGANAPGSPMEKNGRRLRETNRTVEVRYRSSARNQPTCRQAAVLMKPVAQR